MIDRRVAWWRRMGAAGFLGVALVLCTGPAAGQVLKGKEPIGDKKGGAGQELILAIGMNDAEAVRALAAAGVNVDTPTAPNAMTPLMRVDGVAMADLLIGLGADVNARDRDGATPLHHVIMASEGDALVALLLRHGADPNVTASGWSGETPLATARLVFIERRDAARGERIVRALVQAGADIDARDAQGYTLLMSGVVNRVPELVGLVLELGADPAVADDGGRTPLAAARDLGFTGIAKLLRDAGAEE